jgi:hypothetical protein
VTLAGQILETYPKDLGGVDRDKLRKCIEACLECAQVCTACADACLSEDSAAELTTCIRTHLDCADVCDATGRVLSRHTGYDANVTRAVLEACAAAFKACGDECGQHASMHEHCPGLRGGVPPLRAGVPRARRLAALTPLFAHRRSHSARSGTGEPITPRRAAGTPLDPRSESSHGLEGQGASDHPQTHDGDQDGSAR